MAPSQRQDRELPSQVTRAQRIPWGKTTARRRGRRDKLLYLLLLGALAAAYAIALAAAAG